MNVVSIAMGIPYEQHDNVNKTINNQSKSLFYVYINK